MRKVIRGVGIVLILFVLYVVLGATIPYRRQPEISEETKASFDPATCYGSGTGVDRARIIRDNKEALDTRIQMIAGAKNRVILSTFDFRTDEAGLDLLAALYDAAQRGVQVEVFADGFNSLLRMERNPYFYALSSHPNATVRIYNQVNLLLPFRSMGRMHDKYVIVDDTAYLLGGRNSFGYFLGDYEGHKNYDWDVLVYHTSSGQEEENSEKTGQKDGRVEQENQTQSDERTGEKVSFQKSETEQEQTVRNMAESNESSINQLLAYYEKITSQDCCTVFHNEASLANRPSVVHAAEELNVHIAFLKERQPELFDSEYPYLENTEETTKITLLSNPTEYTAKEPIVFYELMELAKQSEGAIRIHTPYIMCNEWMCSMLSALGDRASIMLNSEENNGNPFGAIDYARHKQELIDTGVQLLEYNGGISYHGKVLTMGDRLSVVGSFNMDMRSAYLDTELMLVIDSEAVNATLQKEMDDYESKAAVVDTVDTYKEVPEGMTMKGLSTGRKVLSATLGWLSDGLRYLM